jgi:hypothetical protein
VYLVFKENILIAQLLKRGNKNVDIKFSAHERFWNNLHRVSRCSPWNHKTTSSTAPKPTP